MDLPKVAPGEQVQVKKIPIGISYFLLTIIRLNCNLLAVLTLFPPKDEKKIVGTMIPSMNIDEKYSFTQRTRMPASLLACATPMSASLFTFAVCAFPKEARYWTSS
ncbi:hypothetical protein J437_LFUL002595 [Ladona fulva]|uniref:Uncharacterized protein n=1 Tax=Ladona fulva TaxID=123851 RepID=A0A8K0JTW0_LADFU|nr:hypothetical protein J437_LFUL002595 [Ladona fulva]